MAEPPQEHLSASPSACSLARACQTWASCDRGRGVVLSTLDATWTVVCQRSSRTSSTSSLQTIGGPSRR